MPEPDDADRPVIFYDGVCALCHFAVKFLIARDRAGVLRFAPLQGETFAAFRAATPGQDGLDSVIYVRGYGSGDLRVFVRSEAVLQALRDIGGVWRVVSWARIIPRFIRDGLYDLIARRRYGWFGRYDECRLPTPRQRDQLLP
ncbi:MAG: DUF393 domain-containing protein [Chloroflexi bacterium]|nr:DUF393 domain-containing protein [Chloroflexota bacterium]